MLNRKLAESPEVLNVHVLWHPSWTDTTTITVWFCGKHCNHTTTKVIPFQHGPTSWSLFFLYWGSCGLGGRLVQIPSSPGGTTKYPWARYLCHQCMNVLWMSKCDKCCKALWAVSRWDKRYRNASPFAFTYYNRMRWYTDILVFPVYSNKHCSQWLK